MDRLTTKNDFGNFTSLKYTPKKPIFLDYNRSDPKFVEEILNKLGKLEDIEEELTKHTFYGRVLNFPEEIIKLKFRETDKGNDFPLDIRIIFDAQSSAGSVFYSIFDYGKLWALNKKDLL